MVEEEEVPGTKAQAIIASPEQQEEYTTRLLSCYDFIKAESGSNVSIRHLLDALQTNRELLRTLEECADWSTQSRHECYRELFIALQDEEKERAQWNRSRAEGKIAMAEAGIKTSSTCKTEYGEEKLEEEEKEDDLDDFRPTGVTFDLMMQLLPAAIGNNKGGVSDFAPLQPTSAVETEEITKDVTEETTTTTTTPTTHPVSKLHRFYLYHSTDVERRISMSNANNILNLHGCGLKRFPDLLPQQLRPLKQITIQRNQIKHLPAEMGYCVSLERLICSNNKLSRLPESVARLPYLLSLDVSDNVLDYLPSSIGMLSHLRYLSAANNRLETLPPSLGNLIGLQELNLDGNHNFHHVLQEKYATSLPALIAFLQSLGSCLHLAHEHEQHTAAPGSNVYLPGIADIQKVTEKQIYTLDTLLKSAEFGTVGRIVDVRRSIFRSRAELCTKVRGTPLSLKVRSLFILLFFSPFTFWFCVLGVFSVLSFSPLFSHIFSPHHFSCTDFATIHLIFEMDRKLV